MTIEKSLQEVAKQQKTPTPEEQKTLKQEFLELAHTFLDVKSTEVKSKALVDKIFATYESVLPLTVYMTVNENPSLPMAEQTQFAKQRALKLATTFGNYKNVIEYLKRYEHQSGEQNRLLHDACLFNLPQNTSWKTELWQSLINNNSPNIPKDAVLRLLAIAPQIEAYIQSNEKALKDELKASLRAELFS